jgi:hypothetical protein
MINCTQQLSNTEMTPFFFILILILYPFLIPLASFILIKKGNKTLRHFFSEMLKIF